MNGWIDGWMSGWMMEWRERRRDRNTWPRTESSPQRLCKSLYWEAAGPVLSIVSFWKLILLLPVGQRMYLFHILVSVSVLPGAWGNSEVLIIIIQIMCMEGSVTTNPHLDVNFVGQWHYYFLSVLGTGCWQVFSLPTGNSFNLPQLSPWCCDRKLRSKECQVVIRALKKWDSPAQLPLRTNKETAQEREMTHPRSHE